MMRERSGGQAVWRSALLVLGLGACHGSARPTAGPPDRDSAGIAIVTSTAPAWAGGHGWRVVDTPTTILRDVGEVVAAERLGDGRFVVASVAPTIGLQFRAADGRLLYTVNGSEDGDAPLRSIYHLSLGRADTLAVFDLARGTEVLIGPNGTVTGKVRLDRSLTPAGSNGFLPKGLAPDGRYLLQRDELDFPFRGTAGQVIPDSTRLFWLSRSATLADSSARFLSGEAFGFSAKMGGGQAQLLPLARPLAPGLRVGAAPAALWIGEGRRWELQRLGPDGRPTMIARLQRTPEALTPVLKASFIDRFRRIWSRATTATLQRQFADAMDSVPFPDTLPAYGDLMVGQDSTLWVQHAGLIDGEAGDAALDWTILDANGRWLGDLTLPPHLRLLAAGRGWILALDQHGTNPAEVRLYPLVER